MFPNQKDLDTGHLKCKLVYNAYLCFIINLLSTHFGHVNEENSFSSKHSTVIESLLISVSNLLYPPALQMYVILSPIEGGKSGLKSSRRRFVSAGGSSGEIQCDPKYNY